MNVIGWFAPYGTDHVYAVVQMWIDGTHPTTDPTLARSIVIYDFDQDIPGQADPDLGRLGRLH